MELPKEDKLHGKVLSGSMLKKLEVLVRIVDLEKFPLKTTSKQVADFDFFSFCGFLRSA